MYYEAWVSNLILHSNCVSDCDFACGSVWSLVLREEYRLRLSQNRVLRILGSKRDEVIGRRRNMHKEEMRDLYWMRWERYVERMGEKRNVCRLLVGKPEGKRPPGRQNVDGRITLRQILQK
jgi:hypothetical protein